MKVCSHCHKLQSLDNFCKDKGSKDGHTYLCSPCRKIYRKKQSGQRSDYYKTNKDLLENKRLLYKYGISSLDREIAFKNQNYKCKICKVQDKNLHIDHNHTTRKFRALLCGNCNTAYGLLKENELYFTSYYSFFI